MALDLSEQPKYDGKIPDEVQTKIPGSLFSTVSGLCVHTAPEHHSASLIFNPAPPLHLLLSF